MADRVQQSCGSGSRVRISALADDAEADVVRGVIRGVRAPRRRAQTRESRFPASTAIDTGGAGRNSGIPLQGPGQRLVEIQAPFPDVARHVLESEEARSQRERAYGRGLGITVVDLGVAPGKGGAGVGEVGGAAAPGVVAPGKFAAIAAAGGVFPFRFRRQPIILAVSKPQPLAILVSLETGDIHRGMIVAGPLDPFLPVARIELLVLSIRHGMT